MSKKNRSNKFDKQNSSEKPNPVKETQEVIKLKDGHTEVPVLEIDRQNEAIEVLNKKFNKPWDKFIENLAQEELNRRIKLLKKAFEEYDSILSNLKKIEPDIPQEYDPATGKKLPARYSGKKYKELNSLMTNEKDLRIALQKAKDNNDFSLLYKMYKDI